MGLSILHYVLGEDPSAQGEASRSTKPPKKIKRCGNCNDKLPTDYNKPFCSKCILKLAGKETSQIMKDFLSVQSEMLATLKDFKSSLKSRESDPPVPGPSSQEGSTSARLARQRTRKAPSSDSEDSEVTLQEEGLVESQAEEEDEDARSGKYIFSADDMEGLLAAIYASEQIQHPAEQVSAQDRMYLGLIKPQSKTIPVHQSLKDIIRREWAEPEKKLPKFKTWKRRCPFKDEVEDTFFKVPRLDASLAQVSRQSDLSFEDAGSLRDAMIGVLIPPSVEPGKPMQPLWVLR